MRNEGPVKNRSALGLLWTLISVSSAASAAEGEAPLARYLPEPLIMRSEAFSQLFRSSPVLQKAELGEAGAYRVALGVSYANFWGHDKRYVVDAETRDDQLNVHYQPSKYYEVYGAFGERAFSRSGTDGMAIGFHHLFGLPQDGRLQAKRDTIRLSVPDYGLNYSTAQKNTVFSRQLEAGVVWDAGRELSFPLPTTISLFGTHEFAKDNPYFTGVTDVGTRLSLAIPWQDFALFGSMSFTYFDSHEEVAISTYREQWGGIFGGAYRFLKDNEAVVQFLMYQPIFQDMGQLSRGSYEVHAAYRYTWDQVSFELGLIENVFWVYNSPDWGISAGLTYHGF